MNKLKKILVSIGATAVVMSALVFGILFALPTLASAHSANGGSAPLPECTTITINGKTAYIPEGVNPSIFTKQTTNEVHPAIVAPKNVSKAVPVKAIAKYECVVK